VAAVLPQPTTAAATTAARMITGVLPSSLKLIVSSTVFGIADLSGASRLQTRPSSRRTTQRDLAAGEDGEAAGLVFPAAGYQPRPPPVPTDAATAGFAVSGSRFSISR